MLTACYSEIVGLRPRNGPAIISDTEFDNAFVACEEVNTGDEIEGYSARRHHMKINFAKIRSQAETLPRRLMEDADLVNRCSFRERGG